MQLYKAFAILISILVLDLTWLNGYFLKPFGSMINQVQKEPMEIRTTGLIVAYTALFVLAFIFLPKVNYIEAFVFGFCIYAVYDGTNYSTLKAWDFNVAVLDSIWGGILFLCLKSISQLL